VSLFVGALLGVTFGKTPERIVQGALAITLGTVGTYLVTLALYKASGYADWALTVGGLLALVVFPTAIVAVAYLTTFFA
jgi:hypothetical protein